MDDPGGAYLSAVDAAKVLGLSPGTLRRWAREGRIPTVMIDGQRRFRRRDLDAVTRKDSGCRC